VDRVEWFLDFLDAARTPAVDRPSGPAADRVEWLSVFLAASTAQPPRSEGIQSFAKRDVIEEPGEERPGGKSAEHRRRGGEP
jgi:hypothetical protein